MSSLTQLKCVICKKTNKNEDRFVYVEWRHVKSDNINISMHLYCVLFLNTSKQEDDLDAGVEGFSVPNIIECVKKHEDVKCYYCKEESATIRCGDPLCARYFHMTCGIDSQCLLKFRDQFQAYCHSHHHLADHQLTPRLPECFICDELIDCNDSFKNISSCCDNIYFHRYCIQRFAILSGTDMKCPLCGKFENRKEFCDYLRDRGVYIPDRKAEWENDTFYDVDDENTNKLAMKKNGRVGIQFCCICGSGGMHVESYMQGSSEPYKCSDCITDNYKPKGTSNNNTIPLVDPKANFDDDEFMGFHAMMNAEKL